MRILHTMLRVGDLQRSIDFYTKGVGVCDSLRAGTLMREKAIEMGALQSFANVEVKDLTVEDGHIKSVVTDQGTIDADYVVIATGCWSRQLAAMAGAQIPLTPAVHQMKDIGPVAMFADAKGDVFALASYLHAIGFAEALAVVGDLVAFQPTAATWEKPLHQTQPKIPDRQ